ncbi:MAG TPA: mucoidy inhibitor MuiA family protein [Bacteroidetes bacterium]|nr:mucoidy inhibitor MuiA family protein [Bacteroidota bacterium]
MKTIPIIVISFALLFPSVLRANNDPIPVTGKIQSVTVFQKGAQVFRTGTAAIPSGKSTLVFENLPRDLNPQSLQVSGKGAFTILAVSHRINYLQDRRKNEQIHTLESKLKSLEKEKAIQDGLKQVFEAEESMLLANKAIGGAQNGVETTRLKEVADFLRKRLTEISSEKIKLQEKTRILEEEIRNIRNQLNQMGSPGRIPVSEVQIQVSAGNPQQGKLEISYMVNQAGWTPRYDIRATDIQQPIDLVYKAAVYQNTGEDWKEIPLTLSTGNPQLGGTRPKLNPWYLDFYEPVYRDMQKKSAGVQAIPMRNMSEMEEAVATAPEASTAASYTTVSEGQMQVLFEIKIPYTIPSDGQENMVEISGFSIPAIFAYHAVPKLDRDPFLQAKLTEWKKYNLLPGEMNLFFEGTYVGKSFLDTRSTGDTLELSLGRDRQIIVERTMMRDYSKKQFLGNKVTDTRSWEIRIRNNKSAPVHLVVQDQFPVSTNKEIEVSLTESSGARVNHNTGIFTWNMHLQPDESRTLRVGYEVKYPSGKNIILE